MGLNPTKFSGVYEVLVMHAIGHIRLHDNGFEPMERRPVSQTVTCANRLLPLV